MKLKAIATVGVYLMLVSAGCGEDPPRAEREEPRREYLVEVAEVYELANIVLALTEFGLEDRWAVYKDSDYYRRVLEHFGRYRDHPLLKAVNPSRERLAATYLGFRENSFSYRFRGDRIVHGGTHHGIRNPNLFQAHLSLVEDFARVSSYREFFRSNQGYFSSLVKEYRRLVPIVDMWDWLEERFDSRHQVYRVVFSPLIYGIHSTRALTVGQRSETVMFISGPEAVPPGHLPELEGARLAKVVFTEIDHNYVDPLSRRFASRISGLIDPLREWNEGPYYQSAQATFNEYMTWGVFLLYAYERYDAELFSKLHSEVAKQMEGSRKFVHFRKFSDKLLELYRQSAPQTPISDLYPLILDWIESKKKPQTNRASASSPESRQPRNSSCEA